jgi:hypothetical protein
VITQIHYPGFFEYAFLQQQLQRFAANGFNNVRPWWFYLPVVFVLTLPWSCWLITGRARAGRLRAPTAPGLQSLWWVWSLAVLLFFSIPQSKLVGYAMPALPAVAALLGNALGGITVVSPRSGLARVAIAAATMCVLTTMAFAHFDHKSARDMAAALNARFGRDDRIVMLDRYVYDAPFYLRARTHPFVVASWHDPALRVGDGWQKELLDAASFASASDGNRLVDVADALTMLCGSTRRTWVIADPDAPARYRWLSQGQLVYRSERLAAWEFDMNADAAPCGLALRPPSESAAEGSAERGSP